MTYRGLAADYDAWKTRSDRDDDFWWNEPETEECMNEPADIAALVERLRRWTTDWDGSKMVPGEPPIDGIHCDVIDEAADALEALQAEIERAEAELAAVNNEFGCATAGWPDAWKRVAEVKEYSNKQWSRAEKADEEIKELRRLLVIAEGIRALGDKP